MGLHEGMLYPKSASSSFSDPPSTFSSPAPILISTRTISDLSRSIDLVSCCSAPLGPASKLHPMRTTAASGAKIVRVMRCPCHRNTQREVWLFREFAASNSPVVRPPILDRLLDLLLSQFPSQRFFHQAREFPIGGE